MRREWSRPIGQLREDAGGEGWPRTPDPKSRASAPAPSARRESPRWSRPASQQAPSPPGASPRARPPTRAIPRRPSAPIRAPPRRRTRRPTRRDDRAGRHDDHDRSGDAAGRHDPCDDRHDDDHRWSRPPIPPAAGRDRSRAAARRGGRRDARAGRQHAAGDAAVTPAAAPADDARRDDDRYACGHGLAGRSRAACGDCASAARRLGRVQDGDPAAAGRGAAGAQRAAAADARADPLLRARDDDAAAAEAEDDRPRARAPRLHDRGARRTCTGRCSPRSHASSRASAPPRARSPAAGCHVVPADQADQLRALAAFLNDHGASRNLSAKSTHDALKAYFGSDKTARRVGALAAFYGALGLGRMQHGIGWHGGAAAQARAARQPPAHLRGRPRRHPRPPRRSARADHDGVPRQRDRLGAGLEPRQRPSPVHGIRRRQRARLRPRGRRHRRRRRPHQASPGPRQRHRAHRAAPAAAAPAHAPAPGRLADGRRWPDRQPRLVRAARITADRIQIGY